MGIERFSSVRYFLAHNNHKADYLPLVSIASSVMNMYKKHFSWDLLFRAVPIIGNIYAFISDFSSRFEDKDFLYTVIKADATLLNTHLDQNNRFIPNELFKTSKLARELFPTFWESQVNGLAFARKLNPNQPLSDYEKELLFQSRVRGS